MSPVFVVKCQRVGITTPVGDSPIGAQHQPAEVPTLALILHGDTGPHADQGMRPSDKELLLSVVITGAGFDEGLVRQVAAEVFTQAADPDLDGDVPEPSSSSPPN